MAAMISVLLFGSIQACAQMSSGVVDHDGGRWGDQGNGNYVNPILPADYSDIDVIRVGADYYAISSTMQFSPGMAILHSKDLVNWTIVGHAVSDLTEIGPDLNWDRMSRYGRGVWAGSIRYSDGMFWIYFSTPDEGVFVTTARSAVGPWSSLKAIKREKGWDDCCPFWDDDGKEYLVCTNFSDSYKVHLFELSVDGTAIMPGSDRVIHQSPGSEANKLYKINGLYYHLFSEDHQERGRVVMIERSRSLNGPWEIKQINAVDPAVDREPNQGGLIEVSARNWWFLTHQGSGGHWDGRTMSLVPVKWIDGWPILGKPGADGFGHMVWEAKKPIQGRPIVWPQTNDDFDETTLSPQWEWNYQPRAGKWSLTERPGFLRLHAFKPLKYGDLMTAGNTLSQRAMRTQLNVVVVKVDISRMADGQIAGLCHFAGEYSAFGVSETSGTRRIVLRTSGEYTTGPSLDSNTIWLSNTWKRDGLSQYSYSLDGIHFIPFGRPWQLTWGGYRGDHVGLFTYNDQADSGFVDVDWFQYSISK